jgi:elongation factor P hydroxylase
MSPEAITAVFNRCFSDGDPADRARLVRGGDDPLYLPATHWRPLAEVVYARGLAQSCLHEAAHWLRAGRRRRELIDYGYWYEPDGRDQRAQKLFERQEAEVQGLERILSECAGVEFTISCDNLISPEPSCEFIAAIDAAVARRLRDGLPPRALRFARALHSASRTTCEFTVAPRACV